MIKGVTEVNHIKETELNSVINAICCLNMEAMESARVRQNSLAKPPRSLGRLEELSIQLAGITGSICNKVDKRRIIVLASDNGVVCEGVATTPQYVTLSQTINFTRGLTGVAVLAKHGGAELQVVDMGINANFTCPDVLDRKIAMGTKNIAVEPAMTRQQAVTAIMTGVELARQAADEGVEILGVGEMGIGNTTTSAAVLTILTGLTAEDTVGRGGGLDDAGFHRKKMIVATAEKRLSIQKEDIIDVIAKVGGFDIAAMTGVYLGAAERRIPVVVDGYISIVAALAAARLSPLAKHFLIPSHASLEPGYLSAAQELSLRPILHMDMRLGEGSGCPLAFNIVSAACAVMCNMATFEQAGISDDYLDDIRDDDRFFNTGR